MTTLHVAFVLHFVAMAPRMHALAQSQGQEQTQLSLKHFEAFVTIVVGGIDIDIDIAFLEECMAGLCSMEWVGALTHKHFQMVMKGNFIVFQF